MERVSGPRAWHPLGFLPIRSRNPYVIRNEIFRGSQQNGVGGVVFDIKDGNNV